MIICEIQNYYYLSRKVRVIISCCVTSQIKCNLLRNKLNTSWRVFSFHSYLPIYNTKNIKYKKYKKKTLLDFLYIVLLTPIHLMFDNRTKDLSLKKFFTT